MSQHLEVLRKATWITGRPAGPAVCLELDEASVDWFRRKGATIF